MIQKLNLFAKSDQFFLGMLSQSERKQYNQKHLWILNLVFVNRMLRMVLFFSPNNKKFLISLDVYCIRPVCLYQVIIAQLGESKNF